VSRQHPVIILDFGSQYTQLIARRIREARVYCEIRPYSIAIDTLRALEPRAVILSGGPASVFAQGAPQLSAAVFEMGVPTLGICYGLQLMAHVLGGRVEAASEREYGPAAIEVTKAEGILHTTAVGETLDVWMSHSDKVVALPAGFESVARTASTPYAVVQDATRRLFGVQFHPEVVHTPRGAELLANFLFGVAGCRPDWTPISYVDEAVAAIHAQVREGSAVCGLSGGVDSTVAAVLVHKALGSRLQCIFVDNGVLRKDEAKQVQAMFEEYRPELSVKYVDASEQFLRELQGVTDPEQKRKIIGRVFVEVFEHEARALGNVQFLVQGTLYPDVIESVAIHGPSSLIKSHHNVGGLPEKMNLGLVEPLRELFKDEVRELGGLLGLPKTLLMRQPFPGPGLAIRCLGEVTREKLEILREADSIVHSEIVAAGLYETLWQSFCVLLPVRSVGVMGDERTYDYTIAIRCVQSKDGMTADWAELPYELLARMSSRIINEVRGANRVVYDISSKPPSTIEWE
jgi:GMP synthase (glutamine-hydrolysing)